MDINELSERKAELERQIRNAVANLVSEFKTETGVTPSSIFIYMDAIDEIGQKRRQCVVTDCSAEIEV